MLRNLVLVVALVATASCGESTEPRSDDFVQTVRDQGLAEGYDEDDIRHMFDLLCEAEEGGVDPAQFVGQYPKLEEVNVAKMVELSDGMCE